MISSPARARRPARDQIAAAGGDSSGGGDAPAERGEGAVASGSAAWWWRPLSEGDLAVEAASGRAGRLTTAPDSGGDVRLAWAEGGGESGWLGATALRGPTAGERAAAEAAETPEGRRRFELGLPGLSWAHRRWMSESLQADGNGHFSAKDFEGSINSYNEALVCCDLVIRKDHLGNLLPVEFGGADAAATEDGHAELDARLAIAIGCLSSLAACQLKLEQWEAVMETCQTVVHLAGPAIDKGPRPRRWSSRHRRRGWRSCRRSWRSKWSARWHARWRRCSSRWSGSRTTTAASVDYFLNRFLNCRSRTAPDGGLCRCAP